MQSELKSSTGNLSQTEIEQLLDGSVPKELKASTTSGEPSDQDWTVEETARVLGLSRGAVIRRLEDGILPGYRVKRGYGSAWRVKPIWIRSKDEAETNSSQIKTESMQVLEKDDSTNSGANLDSGLDQCIDKSAKTIPSAETLSSAETSCATNEAASGSAGMEAIDVHFSAALDFTPESENKIDSNPAEPQAQPRSNSLIDFLEVYEADEETKDCAAVPLSTYKELIELRTKLEMIDSQYQETKNRLESANYKIGYLEARLESSQEALRLLGGVPKSGWWQNFCQWFRSSK